MPPYDLSQIDPELFMAVLQEYLQTAPNYDRKGNAEPFSLDYQKDAANYQQDVFDLVTDPSVMMAAGPGSFDPGAFADVQYGSEEFELPADPLAPYLSLSEASTEGAVARALATGASPDEVVATFAAKGVKNTSDDKQLDRIRQLATDLFTQRWQYDNQLKGIPGMVQGADGSYEYQGDGVVRGNKIVVPQYGPSKATQWFRNRGLPLPTDQFTAEDFGYDGEKAAARQAKIAELKTQMLGRKAEAEAARKDAMGQAQSARAAAGVPQFAEYQLDQFGVPQFLPSGQQTGKGPSSTARFFKDANEIESSARKAADLFLAASDRRNVGFLNDSKQTGYAQRMAELHAQSGLTPLAMVYMQRAKATRP